MEIEKLKNIIESCHLNFLIGSGASRKHLGTLGNIEEILTDLAESKVTPDRKQLLDAIIKHQYFKIAIKGNLEILDGDSDELKKTRKAYELLIQNFNVFLKRRKSNLLSKQVNIFTTNMDLFLEYTFENEKIEYNDGFSGKLNPKYGTENFHNSIYKLSTHYDIRSEVPLFNLFKLHGSLNWHESDNGIVYDYSLKSLKSIAQIEFVEDDFISIFDENGNPLGLTAIIEKVEDLDIQKKQIHDSFLEAYNKLVMINPTKDKFATTTQNLLFYELLRMYSNHLERENSVLFVVGFSFADEHIREITKRVAISNPTLLIIIFAFNDKAKQSILSLTGNRSNIVVLAPEEGQNSYTLENINTEFFSKVVDKIEEPNII
jgi:hemerythrin